MENYNSKLKSYRKDGGQAPTSAKPSVRYAGGERGQAVLISVVFFMFISTAISFGLVTPVVTDARLARDAEHSTQSFFLAEAGVEDAVYRLRNSMSIDPTEMLSLNGATTITTTTDAGSNEKDIVSSGDADNRVRKVKTHLSVSSGASFNYGVQAGEGGFAIQNSASISGNAYSNGPITGSNSNNIIGDVISAGPSGSISGINTTGSAYAHTITNTDIDGSAYYQSISGSTVGGTWNPGSPDQPIVDLPIQDSLIEQWKADAEAGGILGGSCETYKITSDVTIGPAKINCDLEISGSRTITLTGALWVRGNISIKNSATLNVSGSISGKTVPIVADKPSNRTSSSKITLENSAEFNGSGTNSYILLVSQNNSAENGGSAKAIEVQNSAEGDLLVYAGHGEVSIANSVSLREVTAYRIRLLNSAEVIYNTGLASLLFSSGPGGSWTVSEWKEIE